MFSSEPHPWFIPLYRRVITMAICVAWLVFELVGQQPFWLIMAGAVNVYAIWEFFLGPSYRGAGKSPATDQDPEPPTKS